VKILRLVSRIVLYPVDKFKRMKPVQRLPFVIFGSVFSYYWIFKEKIDWEKIIGYTLGYWILFVVTCLAIGLDLLEENQKE
jgi:hypothetical protein